MKRPASQPRHGDHPRTRRAPILFFLVTGRLVGTSGHRDTLIGGVPVCPGRVLRDKGGHVPSCPACPVSQAIHTASFQMPMSSRSCSFSTAPPKASGVTVAAPRIDRDNRFCPGEHYVHHKRAAALNQGSPEFASICSVIPPECAGPPRCCIAACIHSLAGTSNLERNSRDCS